MKVTAKIALILTLLVALAWPGTAMAKSLYEDKVVFGGSYTLASGDTLEGNLIVLGGIATLEPGSQVHGDVVLLGGTLEISGEVDGNVAAFGGLCDLRDTAIVTGNATLLGGRLERAQGARVDGNVTTTLRGPMTLTFPGGVQVPQLQVNFSPFVNAVWFTFRTFLWAALAVLVALFLPRNLKRTAQAATSQPLVAGGLGLLTVVITPPLLLVLAITILLIPASLLGAVVLALLWMFGLIALGLEVGNRLAEMFKQNWEMAVSAGVGTFVLILVINGASALIPCVGWVIPAMAGMLGLGAVLLTRFGTQAYPLYPAVVPASTRPPAAPAPAQVVPAPSSEAAPPQEEGTTPESPASPPPEPEEESTSESTSESTPPESPPPAE